MEVKPRIVYNYQTISGNKPFGEWFASLKDRKTRSLVRIRINRLRLGNFGDCRHLGEGIYELRINYGPGYRVYFGDLDGENVILLCGGDKKTQTRDIEKARKYWQELRSRVYE